MSKTTEHCLLFKYVGGELTPLSKPFKTKKQVDKPREKYPERLRKGIAVGVIWIKKWLQRSLVGSQSESRRFGSHGVLGVSVSAMTSNVVAYARSASTLIDSALPLCTNVADSTAEPGRFTSFPGPTTL